MLNISRKLRRLVLIGILPGLMVAMGCNQSSDDSSDAAGLATLLATAAAVADANACKFNEGKFNDENCRFRVSPF